MQLVKCLVSLVAHLAEFFICNRSDRDRGSGMYPDVGVACRPSRADIQLRIIRIAFIDPVRASQDGGAAAVLAAQTMTFVFTVRYVLAPS